MEAIGRLTRHGHVAPTGAVCDVLKRRAVEFQHTPCIGRTHGVHAEPTTFGLKLLLWYSEMTRNIKRFDAAAEDLRVGKLSGAVGTFGHLHRGAAQSGPDLAFELTHAGLAGVAADDLVHRIVGDFLTQVDSLRWPQRDPRAISASITGMK